MDGSVCAWSLLNSRHSFNVLLERRLQGQGPTSVGLALTLVPQYELVGTVPYGTGTIFGLPGTLDLDECSLGRHTGYSYLLLVLVMASHGVIMLAL